MALMNDYCSRTPPTHDHHALTARHPSVGGRRILYICILVDYLLIVWNWNHPHRSSCIMVMF